MINHLNGNYNANSSNIALSVRTDGGIGVSAETALMNLNSNLKTNFDFMKKNKIELSDIMKEIKSLRLILTKLKSKPKQNQEITLNDFLNFLHDSNFLFPADKLCQVMNFLELNHQCFTLKDLSEKLDDTRISLNEISSSDIRAGVERIRDILFLSEKTPKELYDLVSNSLFLTKDQFVKVIKYLQPNFNEILLGTIFSYQTKLTKFMRINDFKQFF